jgi:hypothetical protein
MKFVADDVQSLVVPYVGHFVAEEACNEMLAARSWRRTGLAATTCLKEAPKAVAGAVLEVGGGK